MTATPKPDPFVSGTLTGGRLALVRKSGSIARCDAVLICLGTLTDNSDGSYDLDFPGGS